MAYETLTDEGQQMFDNLVAMTTVKVKPKKTRLTKIVFNASQVEADFFKGEIEKLIKNSELVIQDCDLLIEKYTTAEEYIKGEPRIGKTIHSNFINRLYRILNHLPAFENESHLNA